MITLDEFHAIRTALRDHPEPLNDMPLADHIEWSENAGPPTSAEDFALEAIFVICNSGMRHTVARTIFERCAKALRCGEPVVTARREAKGLGRIFGHDAKAAAIETVWQRRESYFNGFIAHLAEGPESAIEFCGLLPWIGGITKYHLAKNFGVDVAKPDVHLERLAKFHGTTPQALCEALATTTGYKARTVDLILWMACAKGVIKVPEAAAA